jgi:chromosome segregation ATPase
MNRPPPRPPPLPPTVPGIRAPDAVDRLLDAIGSNTAALQSLEQKLEVSIADAKTTNASLRALRSEYARIANEMEDLGHRVNEAERGLKRHDSGFRQTSEVDAKTASDMAALVIAIEDTRKIAKKGLEKIEKAEKGQQEACDETKAQTPVLAKIEDQTKDIKSIGFPTKAAAVFNLAIGIIYMVIEILRALGKHP